MGENVLLEVGFGTTPLPGHPARMLVVEEVVSQLPAPAPYACLLLVATMNTYPS